MIKNKQLRHRFVDTMPEHIEPGVLYVSIEYATATHRCCCGCGEEVVTPFSPAQWQMIFNGDAVSLHPSVGNWNLPCRSHYVIREGRVIEAPPWTEEEVQAGRRRDKDARTRYFDGKANAAAVPKPTGSTAPKPARAGLWRQLKRWLKATFV